MALSELLAALVHHLMLSQQLHTKHQAKLPEHPAVFHRGQGRPGAWRAPCCCGAGASPAAAAPPRSSAAPSPQARCLPQALAPSCTRVAALHTADRPNCRFSLHASNSRLHTSLGCQGCLQPCVRGLRGVTMLRCVPCACMVARPICFILSLQIQIHVGWQWHPDVHTRCPACSDATACGLTHAETQSGSRDPATLQGALYLGRYSRTGVTPGEAKVHS